MRYRELLLIEKLPPDEFYNFRLNRWLEVMAQKEAARQMKNGETVLQAEEFLPLYLNAINFIRDGFKKQPMIWCHGHFKPHELYQVPGQDRYYLIDYAHTSYRPQNYEYGFIVWADYLLGADWKLDYPAWKQGVLDWRESLLPMAKKLGLPRPEESITLSIIERSLASILADVVGADRPPVEQLQRTDLLMSLLKDLLTN